MGKNNRDFKVLDEREHILTRPAMYIGSVVSVEKELWLYNKDDNKFSFASTKFVPALLKICDEIVDNSLDVAIDGNFTNISSIRVNVSDDEISVVDDGPGIPVAPPAGGDEKGRNCPEIAWTQMRSGTSFKENRKGPSANGVGSTCCNVFCKSFIGTSDDGHKRQVVSCYDNLNVIKVSKATKSKGKSGVSVVMKPDLERFGIKTIDDVHKGLIYQRLLNLSICYPQLTFYFNGKKITTNPKKFGAMFSDEAIVASSKNATIVVFPNEYDEFKHYSYVNGLNCVRGGSQVDYVAGEICNRVREKLIKKYKTIRPADVKNRLGLVVFLTDFENAQFDAQTKESLANSNGDISRHLGGDIDFDALAKQVLKNDAIINPIVEAFKIKEELKAKKDIKSSKKIKVKSDKYMSSIGKKKYCVLTEGLSAMSSIVSCLGRDGFGYYAMRGLPINAYSQSMQKISANQEFKDVMNILGLDVTRDAVNRELNYEKILVATDADCYARNTLVETEGGLKKIGDIVVGDRVMGSDGKYHAVVDVVMKSAGVYNIICAAGGKLITSTMQSIIISRNGEYMEVPAKEVYAGDYLFGKNNKLIKVEEVTTWYGFLDETLYDITLEDDHRFFVQLMGSEEMVLAHNCDGSHITSMLVGWFKRFAPGLFAEKRVCKLITPLIIIKDSKGKITDYFFTLAEFKAWEQKNKKSRGTIQYLKGLGSWEREDLQYLIDKDGIERFIKAFVLDENSDEVVEEWLGDDTEPRKKYLRNCNFNIDKA